MIESLAATLAGIVLPILVNALLQWAQGRQDLAASKSAGARDADAAANKESTDALARMSEANAAPRSRGLAAGRLRNGTA